MLRLREIIKVFLIQCCFGSSSQDQQDNDKKSEIGESRTQLVQATEHNHGINSSLLNSFLTLEVIESTVLVEGGVIRLSATGMVSEDTSLTEALSWTSEEDRNEVRLEFIFIEEGLEQSFAVVILKHTAGFYLKSSSKGSGTYVGINSPLSLRSKTIVSFGESSMAILIKPREDM
jgi:hypothetical protein